MKGLLATLPCLYADDTSTLLSMTSKLSLNTGSFAIETFMKGVDGRNVTQMASLMQNLAESQLFGDGVTGEAASGEIKLDSDITEALKMIKDLLLGDIQKALKHEHGLDQHAVNMLKECWDECKVAKDEDQEQVDELWTIMQSSKTSHEVCRKDVHEKYIDKVLKCNALDIWIDDLDCPACYKEECVVVHDPSSRKVGDMLQAHIAWASNSYAEWTVKHAACAQAVREHESADKACDKVQGTFESGTCAHRQAVWTTCNVNQMACCKRCSVEFDAEVNRVECAEKDRKIDWSATKKIECYIDVLMASPTDEELQAKCKKDGKACISQWREDKYKSCEDVCVDIDFEAGDYYLVDGVNTTHRTDSSHGDRCTVHFDIHFPKMPSCVKCPPPIPGPCEEPFLSTYYLEYDSILPVPELENAKECHPDKHIHSWAYGRAECRPCPALIGRTCGGDPSCYFANQVRIFHTDKMGGDAYLNLGEVTVNGGVSMKVTLSDSWSAPHLKDNCVDGDPNTFCHSKHTHGWWVAFNLEEPTCINTIEVLNRHNCCQDRIVGAGISIVNQGTEIWTDTFDENVNKYKWNLMGHEFAGKFERVWSSGSYGDLKPSREDFNTKVWQAGTGLLVRYCDWCSSAHKEVYFRRKTASSSWDYYSTLLITWDDAGFHSDFDIYSTLEDAKADTNAWKWCNSAVKVGHHGVAFPRDCGPNGYVGGAWTSTTAGGNTQNYAWEVLHSSSLVLG